MVMDETLICNEYRFAKYPKKQVRILAELNNCSRKKIIEILERRKAIPQDTSQPKLRRVNWAEWDEKIMALRRRGVAVSVIACAVNVTEPTVYARFRKLKKEGRWRKNMNG